MHDIPARVKHALAAIVLVITVLGLAAVWGFADREVLVKTVVSLLLIGFALFLVDGVIYAKESPRDDVGR